MEMYLQIIVMLGCISKKENDPDFLKSDLDTGGLFLLLI